MAKVQSKVPANPALLDWPADTYGATSSLKREIVSTAGAMNGQADKKEVILAVLRIAIEHVEARFTAQVESNKQSAVWRAEQEKAAEELSQPKGYRSR